ncbi:MAG: helix-turn-helix transcriptional regulator [Clostridia bacterium]|nr:helix-turn-helix transcriptional regulator [Clostridia bacterium]
MVKLSTGERVKDLRQAQGLTLKELSTNIQEKTGQHIAVSTLSYIEAYGNSDKANKEPRFSTLKAITDYFEISLDYLAGKSEVKSPEIKFQAVHKMLGLSEEGILKLQEANETRMYFVLLALDKLLKDDNLYTLDKLGHYLTIDDEYTAERIDGQPIKQKTLFAVEVQQCIDNIRRKVQAEQNGGSE